MGPYHRLRYLISTRGPKLTFTMHRFVYRVSGGRLFPTSGGKMPVLLLTTTGRKIGTTAHLAAQLPARRR